MASPICLITGCALMDEMSGRYVHGDLYQLASNYVFNAVLDRNGETAWQHSGRPSEDRRILSTYNGYFERRGVIVIDMADAALNLTAREYLRVVQ